jgi:hypothetical protein
MYQVQLNSSRSSKPPVCRRCAGSRAKYTGWAALANGNFDNCQKVATDLPVWFLPEITSFQKLLCNINMLIGIDGESARPRRRSKADVNLAAIGSAFGHPNHPQSRAFCWTIEPAAAITRRLKLRAPPNDVLSDTPNRIPLLQE